MLNTMMENESTSFANILIPFLRPCSQYYEHDFRKGIEILAKLVFSFSIITLNMMKLLVILFVMFSLLLLSTKMRLSIWREECTCVIFTGNLRIMFIFHIVYVIYFDLAKL